MSEEVCVNESPSFHLLTDKNLRAGAVYPGQTLLLGKIVSILGVDDPRSEANRLSLFLFVLSLGCLVCYYVLGWAMNVISNVSHYQLGICLDEQ